MLENYYEEISRKRWERRVYWIAVFALSTFLYLFFQGYYPYVKFNADKIEKRPQVVRAFGIVNVRTVPAPEHIWIWNGGMQAKEIQNDDKGFFDFWEYFVTVEKTGYLSIPLSIKLSRENPFSISIMELFKSPEPKPFIIPAEMAENLGDGKLLVRERSESGALAVEDVETPVASGSVYRIISSATYDPISVFRTDARYLGSGLFEKNGTLLTHDLNEGLVNVPLRTLSGTVAPLGTRCENAEFKRGKIFCPESGTEFLPHETTLKDRLLGTGGRTVHLPDANVKILNGRVISGEILATQTGAKLPEAFKIAKKSYRFQNGRLVSANGTGTGVEFSPITDISAVHEFGTDAVIFGKTGNGTAIGIVDERGNLTAFRFNETPAADFRIEYRHGAYMAADGKNVWILYKGAKEPIAFAEGKLLEIVDDGMIVENVGATYLVNIVAGE